MKKFYLFLMTVMVSALSAFAANVSSTEDGPENEIYATIIAGSDTLALNSHSAVSADAVKTIQVAFDGMEPKSVSYSLCTLAEAVGAESSAWVVDQTLAEGAISAHGKAVADLEEMILLNKGTKYALIIKADDVTAQFDINGSYYESNLQVSLLGDEKEFALNTHSNVTIDEPISAIKVAGLDQEMSDVTYAIYGMNKSTLASGTLSVNTIGYAEFAPITLVEANQYNVVVSAGEEVLFDQIVYGACEAPEYEINATIIAGNDTLSLNTHSAISADAIKTIEVSFDGIVPQQAGYSINTLVEVAGEESSTWEVGETLAQGAISLHGKAIVELDEMILLNAGTKYALIINADDKSAQFDINGSYAESNLEVSLLGDDDKVFTLNTHSNVTIDAPVSAIKVAGLDKEMGEVTYAIYGMDKSTLASGVLSVNTIGYDVFAPITLVEANQYNVVVSAGEEVLFDQIVYGACEAPEYEIAATIIAGNDTLALNSHSAISADAIKTIAVSFDGFVPQQAGYSINTLVEVAGEESSTWEVGETLAQGAISLHGKAVVELDEMVLLNAGTKYALIINADDKSAQFDINGSYSEYELAVSLFSDDNEFTLNTHSNVTIDEPVSAIKVAGLDKEMGEVTYAIYGMNKSTLASGVLSVNTIGYAAFAPVTLVEANQYNVVVSAGEEVLFDQIVYGACEAPEYEIAATIIAGEDTLALNSHSAISADAIKTIEVSFDGFVPQQAGYSINTLKEVAGEESSSWEIDETIAQGSIQLHGKAVVELDEMVLLNAGTKYALIINADDKSAEFEINGSYSEYNLAVSLIAEDSTEFALNTHSNVTIDEPISAIKVAGLDQVMGEVTYAIYGMNKSTLASGVLSVNTIGYAEFAPVTLVEANQYNVVIAAGEEVLFDQIVYGACEAPVYEIAAAINDSISLNTHSAISADAIESIAVSFEGFTPKQAGYAICTLVAVDGNESTSWEIGETLAQGEISLHGKAYVALDEKLVLNVGTKYVVIINADNESAQFEINGSYDDDPTAISAIASATESMKEIFSANGAKLSSMQKGINVVRLSNGSVKKIMVK